MNEYTLVVPLYYNDGSKVGDNQFTQLELLLLTKFHGFTDLGQVRGEWQDNDGIIYRDTSRRYAIATDNPQSVIDVAQYIGRVWQQESVYLAQTAWNVQFIDSRALVAA